MGYSATAKAMMVLNTFHDAAVINGRPSGNMWDYRGKQYFFEVGRENHDGACTGTVYGMDGRKAGSFRISPDGHIERAPAGLRAHLNEQQGMVRYYKAHEPGTAWIKACEFDDIPPASSFVVFSAANPYA